MSPADGDGGRERWERASAADGPTAATGRGRERWERWAARRRADGGRGWGPRGAWGRRRSGGRLARSAVGRSPRWRGFGCLFGLVFLVVLGSLVTASASILSDASGQCRRVIVAGRGRGRARRAWAAACGGVPGRSTRSSTRRGGSRTATTRSGCRSPNAACARSAQLVRGFDTMVERLEVDERQRQSLLADVSHELRTPLTRHLGQSRGDDRWRPPDRRRAPGRDPRRDAGHGAAHRRPADGGTVGGRHAHAASGTDRSGRADRRGRAVVRGRGGHGRGDRHGRGRGGPADPRHRSGAAPGGARQSRRERDPAHAGGRHGRDPRRA